MNRHLQLLIVTSGLLLARGFIKNDNNHPSVWAKRRSSHRVPTNVDVARIRPPPWSFRATTNCKATSRKNDEDPDLFCAIASQLQQRFTASCTAAVLLATVLTCPITLDVHAATNNPAGGVVVSIQKTYASAMTENQQFVSDVWWAVTTQYFDPSFNGLGEEGWRAKKKEAVQAVADTGPEDEKIVADAIQTMLSALGDPYTRFLPREKFEALTAYATGGSAGIGVQLLEDPRTHNVVVMGTTGPAATAGIHAGDTIVEVDGESMEGATAEVVAAKCRGEPGGKVDVTIRRGSDAGEKVSTSTERISLTRAKIKVNPIETSTFVSAKSGQRVGLLKVPSFSTETVNQMVDGLRSVSFSSSSSKEGGKSIDAIAIDLRGNVGGYMPAGVDAAKLFLPPRAHIIAEVDKSGAIKGFDSDGIGAETSLPVYVLVDKRTASAAEIFTAALQDNRRAVVVGTIKTFGKGRIQNVQSVGNGSGVAVTKARYVTPSGRDLHGVGIQPNREPAKCEADDSASTCLADIV